MLACLRVQPHRTQALRSEDLATILLALAALALLRRHAALPWLRAETALRQLLIDVAESGRVAAPPRSAVNVMV